MDQSPWVRDGDQVVSCLWNRAVGIFKIPSRVLDLEERGGEHWALELGVVGAVCRIVALGAVNVYLCLRWECR